VRCVSYEVYGLLRDVPFCHCQECRRWSGDLGALAAADNRVDDVAWRATEETLKPGDDYSHFLMDIAAGVYVVGRLAGYTNDELRDRQVPVDEVRKKIAEDEGRAIASRRHATLRLPWRR
jgi:hypothetical protein